MMRTKASGTFFWLALSLLLLVISGCMNVKGSRNVIEVSSTASFDHKRIAILPAKMQTSLSPDSVMAMRTEVNKGLAPALLAKIPTAIVTNVDEVVTQLNQTQDLSSFEQLLSSYEATGVMDRRRVIALGTTLECDFLLVSYLKSEKLDVGFISKGTGASLDIMLIDIRTSEIAWAGSGEWKKGGIFGHGDAPFKLIATDIITSAMKSLYSNGEAPASNSANTKPTVEQEDPVVRSKVNTGRNSKKVIAQAQQQLLALGYNPGPVDGKYGQATSRAVKQFQRDYNFPENGSLDNETIKSLEEISRQ